MKRATREGIRKAEADIALVDLAVRSPAPLNDGVCFHCQQVSEKYLKALLEESGTTIPKTHDLQNLLNMLLPHHPSLRRLRRGLRFLTDFAVDVRYPGHNASKREAQAARRWAERVRQEARALLGLTP